MDPETYGLEEYHVSMPSPKDAMELKDLYEKTEGEAKSYTKQAWDWLKKNVGGDGVGSLYGQGPVTGSAVPLSASYEEAMFGGQGDAGTGGFGDVGGYGYEGSMMDGDTDWW
jgi:hypothetical protein